MTNVTITEIIEEMKKFNENNQYYYEPLKEEGYRIHIFTNGSHRCFLRNKKQEVTISDEQFMEYVKKAYYMSIGEESYEEI